MDTSKKVAPRLIKGTLNVPIASPNDLFNQDTHKLKELYPQNYIIRQLKKVKR